VFFKIPISQSRIVTILCPTRLALRVRVVPRRRGGANYSWDFVPDELGVPILRLLESGVPFAIDYNNARACLRDKHIVFMGDSLTRYQYLNFIQWLRRGNWTTPVPRLEHPGDWIAPDFDHWNFFYAKSSGVLSAPADGIMEYCDCYRLPNVLTSNWEAIGCGKQSSNAIFGTLTLGCESATSRCSRVGRCTVTTFLGLA